MRGWWKNSKYYNSFIVFIKNHDMVNSLCNSCTLDKAQIEGLLLWKKQLGWLDCIAGLSASSSTGMLKCFLRKTAFSLPFTYTTGSIFVICRRMSWNRWLGVNPVFHLIQWWFFINQLACFWYSIGSLSKVNGALKTQCMLLMPS